MSRPTRPTAAAPASILAAAEGYVRRNYGRELSLAEVAAAVPVSPYYLAHLFRRERGTTFLKYLTTVRLQRANVLLLSSDLPIAVIGARVGFGSVKRFRVRYKQTYGLSPAAFRATQRQLSS